MAEEFIENIYENAQLIPKVKEIIECCRNLQIHYVQKKWDSIQDLLAAFCRRTLTSNKTLAESMWLRLVNISKNLNDYAYFEAADGLEEVLPLLYEAITCLGTIDVTEGNYRIFSPKSGYLSIQNIQSNSYLCSRIDPVWEGKLTAQGLYNPKLQQFCTLGCGLGYLCWQMYEVSNENIDIYVYDNDITLVDYAMRFGVLEKIPSEKLHIFIEEDSNLLLERLSEHLDYFESDMAIFYFEDNSKNRLTNEARELVDHIETMVGATRNFNRLFEQNYYRNRSNVKSTICDLLMNNYKKEWVVVGGGPSVDENIDYLRSIQNKKIIIAATTIYGKLLKEKIYPNFIAVIDPQNRTYGHMKNINHYKTPLIMADYANLMFGEKYQGEKYLVPMSGHFYSEEFCEAEEQKGFRPLLGRGTVTAFCIDIAERLGAEFIELIGADLSYPDSHTHAIGTMDDKEIDYTGLIKVRSVDGGEVYTSHTFYYYIKDIEDQIKSYPYIKFYNRSIHGAYIEGCSNISNES